MKSRPCSCYSDEGDNWQWKVTAPHYVVCGIIVHFPLAIEDYIENPSVSFQFSVFTVCCLVTGNGGNHPLYQSGWAAGWPLAPQCNFCEEALTQINDTYAIRQLWTAYSPILHGTEGESFWHNTLTTVFIFNTYHIIERDSHIFNVGLNIILVLFFIFICYICKQFLPITTH